MIALGLDPSITGFGWVIHDSEGSGVARIVARGHQGTSAKDIFVTRYMTLRELVAKLLTDYPQIEVVGIESPTYGEQWSPGAYGLFLMVNEAVYLKRKNVIFFDPETVKMLAKGDPKIRKGKMFKTDMVDAAKADTNLKGRLNHNEADAYLVAKFTARFWLFFYGKLVESDLTPSEHRAFARVHTFSKGKRKDETIHPGAVFKEGKRFYQFSLLEPVK